MGHAWDFMNPVGEVIRARDNKVTVSSFLLLLPKPAAAIILLARTPITHDRSDPALSFRQELPESDGAGQMAKTMGV